MLPQSQQDLEQVIAIKLNGTRLNRFFEELFSNSGHFLILKTLYDFILYGWIHYLTDPTQYFMIFAMLVQAWYLSRPNANRFWGNLIGVAIYTLIDIPTDGWEFFTNFSHLVFWVFSLIIAILQRLRQEKFEKLQRWLSVLESMMRTLMVLAFYLAVKVGDRKLVIWEEIGNFTDTNTHIFLAGSLVLVGMLLGLQSFEVSQQKQQLKAIAQILKNLAKWGMGSHAIATAVTNPEELKLQRQSRTILFMDIRGFTQWCEQNSPDMVANVLNDYYQSLEPKATQYHPLRVTFTADEIMAIYASPDLGISAALSMQKAAAEVLIPHGMGAGCALHCGNVIEGLFGSDEVRTYTVIGDVVNTAKRLESATAAGEITISDSVYQLMKGKIKVEAIAPILGKGKTEAIKVWRLIPDRN